MIERKVMEWCYVCFTTNCDESSTVELHLSGLIGTASHPDTQKIRITGYFFKKQATLAVFTVRIVPARHIIQRFRMVKWTRRKLHGYSYDHSLSSSLGLSNRRTSYYMRIRKYARYSEQNLSCYCFGVQWLWQEDEFRWDVYIVQCMVFGRWNFQTVGQEGVTNAATASCFV